jgi:hypothetical protein
MSTRSVRYGPQSWRVRWGFAAFFGRGYFGRLRWPVRLVAWLLAAGIASLAGWQYALLGPLAFEVVYLIAVAADVRRVRHLHGPVALHKHGPLVRALRAEASRQAALRRVASPGGWTAPAGVRPAWNWTPPPGIEPRLDRVPVWARVWYGCPLIDRYAHAWLWYHGGWDVIPPESWPTPSSPNAA